MELVETELLTKRYGDFAALRDCTFNVRSGEIYGLLGPNGAGKTTLIRLLLGFLRPSSGTARIDGLDCFHRSVEVRQRVSYLPAEARLFRRLRAKDVLQFFAAIRGPTGDADRAMRLAGRLDLDVRRRVALMSTGMRQKLALAATLAHDTRLLILDEPTANLDPNVRLEVMAIVRQLRDEGRTLLISSHVLSEIEEICDRVLILREGKVVHVQDMRELRQQHRISSRWSGDALSVPAAFADRVSVRTSDGQICIETEGDIADILPWISSLPLREARIEPYGLRSVYEQFHSIRDEP